MHELEIKEIRMKMAKERLSKVMGNAYTHIVLACLTCLDKDGLNLLGNDKDLWDEDCMLVGVVFVEKVLLGLEGISIELHVF